jgi:four helix bundle protein
MQDYRKLRVWQKAHALTVAVYSVSARLTAPAAWPLRDQLLRAVISVPSNIAEGAGRGSDPDFRRFLLHSLGRSTKLSMICSLLGTWGSFPRPSTRIISRRLKKSGACSAD